MKAIDLLKLCDYGTAATIYDNEAKKVRFIIWQGQSMLNPKDVYVLEKDLLQSHVLSMENKITIFV